MGLLRREKKRRDNYPITAMVIYPQFAFVSWWFKMLENSFVPYFLFSFIKGICHFLKFTQNIKKKLRWKIFPTPNSCVLMNFSFAFYILRKWFSVCFFLLLSILCSILRDFAQKKNESGNSMCDQLVCKDLCYSIWGRCWAHVIIPKAGI